MKPHWFFDLDIVATIVAAAAFAFCGWLMGGEFVAALAGLAAISVTGAGLARKARRDEARLRRAANRSI